MTKIARLALAALLGLGLAADDALALQIAPAADTGRKDKKDKDDDDDDKDWDGGPLFKSSDSVLTLRIAVKDMRALLRDRDSTKVQNHDGVLGYVERDGRQMALPIQLRTRGVWRRKSANCDFPPLRFNLPPKDSIKGTLFAKHKVIKMVTHCRTRIDDYEQYTVQEQQIYKMHNQITPLSFRARLARITYVDEAKKQDSITRFAILLEDDDDVAKRNKMKVIQQIGGSLDDVEQQSLAVGSLFQYLVGNTDWAIFNLHNIRLLVDSAGQPYAVPYDWDFSGMVATRYSVPDPRLPIKSTRERLYRGNCRTEEQWAPVIAKFNAEKDAIYAIVNARPMLEKGRRERMIAYLDDFYKTINNRRAFKAEIIDACKKGVG